MHLLYLNGDKTLHDCADMDDKNIHFSYIIKVKQENKQHQIAHQFIMFMSFIFHSQIQ